MKDHIIHFAEPLPVTIDKDDPDASGASHVYSLFRNDCRDVNDLPREKGSLIFQQGPRTEEGSIEGLSDAAVLTVILDRLRGFQRGPHSCRENSLAITKIEEAMWWMAKRQNERHERGVLGKNEA